MKKKSKGSYFTCFSKTLLTVKVLIVFTLVSSIQANAKRSTEPASNSKKGFVNYSEVQQREVQGTVKDQAGEPLVGVNVYVKETFQGTATDINGEFKLQVNSDENILVFSSVGMKTQEIVVGTQTRIEVVLLPDELSIDEVVVVAYGTRRKGAITGSVDVISAEDLDQSSATSFDQALQGKATGVQVIQSSGMPGAKAKIKIRGTGSINLSSPPQDSRESIMQISGTEPLFVIDGVPTNSAGFSELNVNDIESMSVLKDASAASLYGSRAANGVVLITTKSGKEGETQFTFRAMTGIAQRTSDKFRMMNAREFIDYEILTGKRDANDPDIPQLLANDHSWMDDIFRNGKINSYELGISGGNEKTTFYTSLSYFMREGIIAGTDMDRYNMRINLNQKVNDKISFGTNLTLGKSHINTASTATNGSNPMISAYMNSPYHPSINPDGSYGVTHWSGGWNYLEMMENITQYDDNYKLLGGVYLEIEPIEGLKIKESFGIDYFQYESFYYLQPDSRDVQRGRASNIQNKMFKDITTVSTTTINYNKILADNHNVGILAGFEVSENAYNGYTASGTGFSSDFLTTLASAAKPDAVGAKSSAWGLVSLFGSIHYDFRTKYILDLSLRRDGSSRFGENNRYGNFYSVGVGWNLHSESFISDLNIFDILRLRGSYGTSGNYQINDFTHLSLYGYTPYNESSGAYPIQTSNDDLTWEKNKITSIGIEFTVLGNRLSGTMDYYNRITKDLLFSVPLSYTSGFSSRKENIGSVKNHGYELALEGDLVRSNDFSYKLGFSVSANRNEILELYGGEDIEYGGIYKLTEGKPFNSFYIPKYAGVNTANGDAIFYNEDGSVTTDYTNNRQLLNKTLDPDYFGNISNKLSYKGIDLLVDIYYSIGNYVVNGLLEQIQGDGQENGNQDARVLTDAWKQPGDVVDIPKQSTQKSRSALSTRELEDASFLRIKDVTLAYTIPEKYISKVGLKKIRVYFKGVNLWTYTKFTGFDPELQYGPWTFEYPPARTYNFGIDIKF